MKDSIKVSELTSRLSLHALIGCYVEDIRLLQKRGWTNRVLLDVLADLGIIERDRFSIQHFSVVVKKIDSSIFHQILLPIVYDDGGEVDHA